jgi:hypothetical protein
MCFARRFERALHGMAHPMARQRQAQHLVLAGAPLPYEFEMLASRWDPGQGLPSVGECGTHTDDVAITVAPDAC